MSGEPQGLINISGVVSVLWRRKIVIALTTLICIGLALAYVTTAPKSYVAVSTIVIDPRQENVTGADSVLSGIGPDSAAISSQVEILRSRTLLAEVYTALRLDNDPEFSDPGLIARLTGRAEPSSSSASFETFRNRVKAERQGLTYVLTVSFTSRDPEKAATVVNAIVETYRADQVGLKSQANSTVTRQLDVRIETLEADVAAADAAVDTFRARNGILRSGSGGMLYQAQLDQLSGQLSAVRAEARAAETRHAQAAAAGASGDMTVMLQTLTSPAMDRLRDEHAARTVELSSLQSVYGPRHPGLATPQTEVAQLENLIRSEAQRVIAQFAAEKELAFADVEAAENELERLRAELERTNASDIELRQLERKAEAARLVLEEFLRRARETEELDGFQNSDARVISPAVPPISAAWPRSNLILAVAGALGLLLGCALALMMDRQAGQSPSPASPTGRPRSPSPEKKEDGRPTSHSPASGHLAVVGQSGAGETASLPELPNQREAVTLEAAPGDNARAIAPTRIYRDTCRAIEYAETLIIISVEAISQRRERSALAYGLTQALQTDGYRAVLLDCDPSVRTGIDARFSGRRLHDLNGRDTSLPDLHDETVGLDIIADTLPVAPAKVRLLPSHLSARLAQRYQVVVVNGLNRHVPISALSHGEGETLVLCLHASEMPDRSDLAPLTSRARFYPLTLSTESDARMMARNAVRG